jgi:hypothetical protein
VHNISLIALLRATGDFIHFMPVLFHIIAILQCRDSSQRVGRKNLNDKYQYNKIEERIYSLKQERRAGNWIELLPGWEIVEKAN